MPAEDPIELKEEVLRFADECMETYNAHRQASVAANVKYEETRQGQFNSLILLNAGAISVALSAGNAVLARQTQAYALHLFALFGGLLALFGAIAACFYRGLRAGDRIAIRLMNFDTQMMAGASERANQRIKLAYKKRNIVPQRPEFFDVPPAPPIVVDDLRVTVAERCAIVLSLLGYLTLTVVFAAALYTLSAFTAK